MKNLPQSIFYSATQEGAQVAIIWWVLFGICFFIFFIVIFFLIIGLFQKRPSNDKFLMKQLAIVSFVTFILLVATIIASYKLSSSQVTKLKPFLKIEVTGVQWWWRVRYFSSDDDFLFETANEITIPVNKVIQFKLISKDVIHSFWVPKFTGKVDMIPGRANTLTVLPEKLGRFRGQCAEFCGIQHAKMSFYIDVVDYNKYQAWQKHQQSNFFAKEGLSFLDGRKVFKKADCIKCHSIRGLYKAQKYQGPDLTHLGGRETLAAGSIPNNTGHLAGWIIDPQSQKPGTLMPSTKLDSKDFKALLSFLRSLK